MPHRVRAALSLCLLCVFVPSCPPPRAVASPTSSTDPAAQAAFRSAEQKLQRGETALAEAAFRDFLARFAHDVLAPRARLYLGRIALQRGRPSAARDQLTPVAHSNTTLRDDARYFLGLAEVRAGKHAQARKLLEPLLASISAEREPALRAALARTSERLGDRLAAVGHLDALLRKSKRQSERVWARYNMERIVGTDLGEAQARSLFQGSGAETLLRALAAQRLIALALARGDIAGANKLRSDSSALRARFGVGTAERKAARAGRAVGLLVPKSGRYRTAGRLLLRAAVSACGAFDSADAPITLVIRDSAKDAAGAARELLNEGVVALVGTLSPSASRAVAALAAAAKVPFVSLSSASARGALRV
ncbi:MAG: ABC transporter substrate-binding protein, partial [Myxococcales bacterium]|nr:ABC transporter substrate-binding protein [Myxococcales bacterium]